MDQVCSLSLSAGVKTLQAAVREFQASKRASYAVKDRPQWWKEKHQVQLPDGTMAVTGTFVSHSKRAWTLPQVKAMLVLYYRFLNGDEDNNSDTARQSQSESEQQRSQHTKTEQNVCSNPSRTTRSRKKEEALVDDSLGEIQTADATATEEQSNRASRNRVKKPMTQPLRTPRHVRGKSRGRKIIESESECESTPSSSPTKKQKSSKHSQISVQSPETHKHIKSPANARRSNRRPTGKKGDEEMQSRPEDKQVRFEDSTPTTVKTSPQKISSPKKQYHSHKPSKTIKRSVRLRPTGASKTAPLPQTNLAIKSESLQKSSKETSPAPARNEKRRRNMLAKAEEQITPTRSLRLKRTLASTHAETRTPLAPLQDNGNERVNRSSKRRKVDGAGSLDQSKQKRSKNTRLSHMQVDEVDAIVEKENKRPSTGDSGDEVSHVKVVSKKTKQKGGSSSQKALEDDCVLEANDEVAVDAHSQSSLDEDSKVRVGSDENGEEAEGRDGDEEDEAAMAAAEEKRREQILVLIQRLEKAREEALQKLEDKRKSQLRNIQAQARIQESKLKRAYKVQRMHMRKEELSTLVKDMVYEYKGDTDQILLKDFESAAQRIVHGSEGAGAGARETRGGGVGNANGGVRFAEGAKTPRARSLRTAVAMATAEQKRLNFERCEATRNNLGTVRRSQRKAAQAATERTKRILSKSRGVEQQEQEEVDNGKDVGKLAFIAIHAEMRRVLALPNGVAALAALKGRVDEAFSRLL